MPEAPFPLQTLPQLIRGALTGPREVALIERGDGGWVSTSSQRLLERIENVACAIRDAGLNEGDRVALIAHDCVDWVVCDFAISFAGCVVVPIYPTQALDHTDYILHHAECKLIFVDSHAGGERLGQIGKPLPRMVLLEGGGERGLAAFEARGAAIRAEHPQLPDTYETALQPNDLAVLIYTSGTTGSPKGVMLSHDNIAFDARAAKAFALERIEPDSKVLSVLPFSHIFEHTMIYVYLLAGLRQAICHDPNALLADLLDIEPVAMTCVPRIFDRVVAGVTAKALHHGGLQAKLVPWALNVGRDYARAITFGPAASPGLTLQYAIAKRLVLKRVRTALGLDALKYFSSGSAALHVDLAMTFLGMGMPIVQGYGLTESAPVITVNRFSRNRYGTVGAAIPGVDVKIADDGEVLARGRNIMMRYYRDEDATHAALRDGWLYTGDIGTLDADGYLRITDRKKEVFKTATGKFVAPARVEAAIKRSVFLPQALVIGDGRPFPIAVVCPNWDLVRVGLKIDPSVDPEDLAALADVRAFVRAEVRAQTADLGSYEQIRHVVILPREFSVESGELSPAMKVKRRVVESRYGAQIDAAYETASRASIEQ